MFRHPLVAIAGAAAVIAMIGSPSAAATPSAAHSPSVVIRASSPVRVDRQNPPPTVTFRGVSRGMTVVVDWGDGSAPAPGKGRCAPQSAKASPVDCAVTLTHRYTSSGTFRISARSGALKAAKTVVVTAAPAAWRPPAGWQSPGTWDTFFGASFAPCAIVPWYFDATGQPADRATMKSDVASVLMRLLFNETHLIFVEVDSKEAAQLRFAWMDMQGAGVAAVAISPTPGGPVDVTFATDDPYTADQYAGFGPVHFLYTGASGTHDEPGVPGRGWMVARMVGLALGLAPVSDPDQLMFPAYFGPGHLGAGDLEGLHTMYRDLCPV